MSIGYGLSKLRAATTDTGRTQVATKGVVQDGLVLNLDAGSSLSYPGTGTVFYDLKNNHDFTLTSGPTYLASDNYGGIVFDGVNDHALVTGGIPLSSPISLTDNFTIEQAFKPTAYQTSTYYGLTNMLMNKGSAATYNYATQITNNTTFSFIKRGVESLQFHNFTVPAMLGKVNVVSIVVKNGNNTSIDTVECYFNGEFVSSQSISGLAISANDNEPFYLCGLGSVQYTMLIGTYYFGRIYNRALSTAEIKRNFNAYSGRFSL